MIQLDLNMKMPDKCSECNFFRVHNKLYCTAVVGNTTVSKPRERRPAWCPLHEVTDTDTISRQAAIDAIRVSTKKYTGFMEMEMYTDDDAVEAIEGLPSAQPKYTCVGCKHYGMWENEVEYGYHSPCTGCKRRANDQYEQ